MLVAEGAHQQSFTLHRDLITKRSKVFATKTVDLILLQEFDPEIFDQYLRCVYQNKAPKAATWVACEESSPWLDRKDDQKNTDSQFQDLLSLYTLANRLEDPGTANLVIGEMRRFCSPSKLPRDRKWSILLFARSVNGTLFANCSWISISTTRALHPRACACLGRTVLVSLTTSSFSS